MPALYDHLISFTQNEIRGRRKGLLYRDDQGDYWWELRPCDYYSEFEREKIAWAETAKELKLVLVSQDFYLLKTCFLLTGKNLKYIIGTTNSTLMDWYVRQTIYQLGETGIYASGYFMEQIPIPHITSKNMHMSFRLESLVSQILNLKKQDRSADTSHLESQIDQLVYELYDLTPEEIAIIEGNSNNAN